MSVTSVEVGGGVVVALDRSKRANSIDLAAAAELRAALLAVVPPAHPAPR